MLVYPGEIIYNEYVNWEDIQPRIFEKIAVKSKKKWSRLNVNLYWKLSNFLTEYKRIYELWSEKNLSWKNKGTCSNKNKNILSIFI